MSNDNRRQYTAEFKIEAVKMVLNGRSVNDVADGLGINASMLSRWKREYLKDHGKAFPGKGQLNPDEKEIADLKKRLRDKEEENAILKKALAIFSKHQK